MRGFTMVELIVVMAVLAILSAVAMPRLVSNTSLQERGAQAQLRGLLVHARQLAVAQQRDVCVLVNAAQASAVYTVGGACNAAASVAAPGGTGPYIVTAPNGVVFGGAALLRFNSLGQPAAAANQTVTVGSVSLTVQRETGVTN